MRKFSVYTEFAPLKEILVCRPSAYRVLPPINEVEAYYLKTDPPTREGLMVEHYAWTDALQKLGVTVSYIDAHDDAPQQMFMRDVGFAIGEDFFLANMAKRVRKKETVYLEQWLQKEKVDYKRIKKGTIEGGDVMVHSPYVFVGISRRTTMDAVNELKKQVAKKWTIIPIQLPKHILHLDCVLSILNTDTIIWCPDLLADHRDLIEDLFTKRITVTEEEVFHLACNILTINPGHILIEAKQIRLAGELDKIGIRAHPIDWTQIKKLGGLFRCASCPLS